MSNIKNVLNNFTNIYDQNTWNMGQNESKSGLGSSLEWSKHFSDALISLIEEKNIKSILDCSCGDWNWMKHIAKNFEKYVGLDCVQSVIDNNNKLYSNEKIMFVCEDMNTYMNKLENKEFDLVIIRHTLEHLPLDYSINAVSIAQKISKYSFITSYSEIIENKDLNFPGETYRPISLESEPFKSILKKPIKIYYDSVYSPLLKSNYAQMHLFYNTID